MASWSPTVEGFRAVFRRPSVPFAEVLWRWSFGAAAVILIGFGFIEYLDTLPVSNADVLRLRSGQPFFISQAAAHILQGSGVRFVLAAMMIFAGLAALWIAMAAVGRGATLDAIVNHLRERSRGALDRQFVSGASGAAGPPSRWRVRSLAGLHFLRVGLALAAGCACLAALILAGFVSTKQNPQPKLVFLLAIFALLLVWLAWTLVSGFLSMASVFVVHAGQDTFGAISATADFFRDRRGPIAAVSVSHGIVHLVLFFVATSVVALPLGFAGLLPLGLVLAAVVLLTLVYFVLVDTLYVARLAGYVAILEAPPAVAVTAPVMPSAPTGLVSGEAAQVSAALHSSMVDQDELILSDTTPADSEGIQQSALSIEPPTDRVDPDELILSDHLQNGEPGTHEN